MGESPEAMHYDEDRVRPFFFCTTDVWMYTKNAEDFLSPCILYRYCKERCD